MTGTERGIEVLKLLSGREPGEEVTLVDLLEQLNPPIDEEDLKYLLFILEGRGFVEFKGRGWDGLKIKLTEDGRLICRYP